MAAVTAAAAAEAGGGVRRARSLFLSVRPSGRAAGVGRGRCGRGLLMGLIWGRREEEEEKGDQKIIGSLAVL